MPSLLYGCSSPKVAVFCQRACQGPQHHPVDLRLSGHRALAEKVLDQYLPNSLVTLLLPGPVNPGHTLPSLHTTHSQHITHHTFITCSPPHCTLTSLLHPPHYAPSCPCTPHTFFYIQHTHTHTHMLHTAHHTTVWTAATPLLQIYNYSLRHTTWLHTHTTHTEQSPS